MSFAVQPSPNQSDILEVIANLSSNEVFTPPRRANEVLDLLPPSVWTDPTLRWLDPGSKTGVFPREVARRLMKGLSTAIPDEQERLRHILTQMVYAIAITDTTAMMTRRSLYCSKDAISAKAAVRFDTPDGNVWFRRTEHAFDSRGRCEDCGGSKSQLEHTGRDNHAYALIHRAGREALEKEMEMKFDVIVGNPPFQMEPDGGNRTLPIYDIFVTEAMKLNPRYLTMIIPSRWMAGGLGLNEFRSAMLEDDRIRKIVDFAKMDTVFPGVDFEGGVCYFLWNRDSRGSCEVTFNQDGAVVGPVERSLSEHDIFVRDARALAILEKVRNGGGSSVTEILAADKEFGMTSNWTDFHTKERPGDVALYYNEKGKRLIAWMPRSKVPKSAQLIDKWKVLIPQAYGERGAIPAQVLGLTQVVGPPSVCTQTFLFLSLSSEAEARSAESYVRTRFFRFLVSLRKITQHATRSTYTWVPQQPWDRRWTDDELYAKYNINREEQDYIASMVKEMPE